MSSKIANKIKINLRLVSIKVLYYSHNSVCHCSQLDVNSNNCFVCYSSLHSWVYNNNCSTDLYNGLLSSNTARSRTRLTALLLTPLPALSCLLYDNVNSLMNVLEVEHLCKCKHRCLVIVVSVFLFTFILAVFVIAFLFTCLLLF